MSAVELVRAYLDAMERRDLDAAGALLAADFEMVFPGGRRLYSLAELIDWARPRYRRIGKRYQRFDQLDAVDRRGEYTVVYCYGTLHGVWPDGATFDGVRFIDRFTLRDGRLREQLVWNDLAEARGGGG